MVPDQLELALCSIHFNRIPPNENSALRIRCSYQCPHPNLMHHPGHSENAGRQDSRLRWRRLFFSKHVADFAQSVWRFASPGQPGGSPASKPTLYSWTDELLKLGIALGTTQTRTTCREFQTLLKNALTWPSGQ